MDEIERHKWSYLTEGGKHVVFSCENQAWLLRLDKSDLVRGGSSLEKSLKSDCAELFLGNYLEPYVSIPVRFELSTSFAERLLEEAIGCGRIPESRERDWSSKCTDETENLQQVVGQIVKDARTWHSELAKETKKPLSVEIKPKAGYRSFSPFVDPQRRIKYQFPRFRLLQKIRESAESMSEYNPLDLFSGNFDGIENAIRELIKCPKNNLKVWKERESCDTNDNDFFGNRLSIVKMISTLLLKEPCLAKLLEIQRLDILDGDGGILLFEHLVDLCHGQENMATDLIDSSWTAARDQGVSIIKGSPIHIARPSRALKSLYEKIELFSEELARAWPNVPSTTYLDRQRKEALEVLYELDQDDSVFLLQNWLLSLCLCDISIFITFSCVSHNEDILECFSNSCTVERLQEVGVPGLLTVQSSDGSSVGNGDVQFEYCINIIDFDRKPASKLKTRLSKEIGFNGLNI